LPSPLRCSVPTTSLASEALRLERMGKNTKERTRTKRLDFLIGYASITVFSIIERLRIEEKPCHKTDTHQ